MSSQSSFLLIPKHLLPVPREWGDIQGMQWFALPWVPGVPQAWHLLSAGHHPRSNVSTSAPAAGTFPSELLSCFFPSRAIPSLPLPADGITRVLYPPEPRCNWIRAPALPRQSLSSFSQTPPVERSCFWSTALPWMELTPSPALLTKRLFSNRGVILCSQ